MNIFKKSFVFERNTLVKFKIKTEKAIFHRHMRIEILNIT